MHAYACLRTPTQQALTTALEVAALAAATPALAAAAVAAAAVKPKL